MDLLTNCLLCRASVENFINAEPFDHWLEDVAVSLCEALGLESYFQHSFQNAVYCDACLFTIRDMEFTLKNIQTLQQRLDNYRLRVSTLLEVNYDEVGSDESILGIGEEDRNDSYENVITSIWTALSIEKKPDLIELKRSRSKGSTSRASSRFQDRSGRDKISVAESPDISDCDSDFLPNIEPLVKIETDIPVRRKRSRKNPTPVKVPRKSSTKRKSNPSARQNKSKELPDSVTRKSTFEDALKVVKLKKQRDKTAAEASSSDENSGDEDSKLPKKRRKTSQGKHKNPDARQYSYSKIKKFNCSFEGCTFRCDDERRFQVHSRVHEGDETPYHCDFCPDGKFTTNPARYYHQKFICPANADRFKQKYAIRTPKSSEVKRRPRVCVDSETESDGDSQTQDTEEFKCTYEGCAFSTRTERRYQSHIRVHEGDPLPYWCDSCDKKFPKAKHLNLHKHRNCGNVILCTIPGCTSVFPHGPALKAHLNTFHYNEGKSVCPHCSKVFQSSEAEEFKEHEMNHEVKSAEGRKFACIIGDCVSNFTNSVDLRDHVLLEHEANASKCEICQLVFAHPTSLKQHMTWKHRPTKNAFKCDQCSYVSPFASFLRVHMRKHSGVKPFACTVDGCDKEFKWPSGLKSHMVTAHTGERNHKCTFENCTKAFVSATKLKDHEETHSDRRSYFCDRCAKSFKAKKNLKQHFRYVHNVGFTSVKSARRDRMKLIEAGLELDDSPGPSRSPKPTAKRVRQSDSRRAKNIPHSFEQGAHIGEFHPLADGVGSTGRPQHQHEHDVIFGTGGWTYPIDMNVFMHTSS